MVKTKEKIIMEKEKVEEVFTLLQGKSKTGDAIISQLRWDSDDITEVGLAPYKYKDVDSGDFLTIWPISAGFMVMVDHDLSGHLELSVISSQKNKNKIVPVVEYITAMVNRVFGEHDRSLLKGSITNYLEGVENARIY